VVAESNEGNNCIASTSKMRVTGTDVLPDFIVSTLIGPIDVAPGQVINLSEATQNQGNGATTVNTVTRFYWSTNTTYNGLDMMLGQRTVEPLAAGEISGPVDTLVMIPSTAVAGTYYIIAWADTDKSISETLETNNTKYITVKIRPDLIVSTLTGPTDVAPGQVISFSEATKNQGNGATTVDTVTRFYWSTNTTYNTSDVVLGERTVGPLAAGETSGPIDTLVTIPPTAVSGTYYIIAWADADKSVAEIADNNRKYLKVTVPP
jgi:heme/copper-type cytochrome/quinol oxidase subunit 2